MKIIHSNAKLEKELAKYITELRKKGYSWAEIQWTVNWISDNVMYDVDNYLSTIGDNKCENDIYVDMTGGQL